MATFCTYDIGNHIEYKNGQRILYSGAIPTSDPLVTMETVETILNLSIMASEVPLDAPWTAPSAAEWDAQMVATWMDNNISSRDVRSLFTLAVQAVSSAELRDVSFLHFLFYFHSGDNLNTLLSVNRGAQESRFSGGAQAISNKVAEALGESVVLNAPVHTIAQDDTGVRVKSDILLFMAKRAIVAIHQH